MNIGDDRKGSITAAQLRQVVAERISASIDLHRASREFNEAGYAPPVGPPTDNEIDDFLFSNALLDGETIEQLVDPGLLGFSEKRALTPPKEWLKDFYDSIDAWSENQTWLAADEPWWLVLGDAKPKESATWHPESDAKPKWIETSPSVLLLAADLLQRGRLLSELGWRDFEKLIGELLGREGWSVTVTRGSKDGGVDVFAEKHDPLIGHVRSLWQAKKYGPQRKVKLSEVREMSAVLAEQQATKAVIVTTSHLTRGAIAWIERDIYRLGYQDRERMELWIRKAVFGL